MQKIQIAYGGVEGAMRGYRPQVDWGGEEGPATIKVGGHNVKLGTAGWRKRCLLILLVALFLLAVFNLILIFWMLRKIGFNAEGAGNLRIMVGGVALDGIARLDHELRVNTIRGRPSEDLDIKGFYNITLATVREDGTFGSGCVLGPYGLTVATKGIQLKDQKGNFIFGSKNNNISTEAKFLVVTGEEGAIFDGSLQTNRIQGDEVHEFRLESETRSLTASAGNLLQIEARDGDVTVTSIDDVALTSSSGKFRFESPNFYLPSLFTSKEEPVGGGVPVTTPATDTQIPAPNIMEAISKAESRGDPSTEEDYRDEKDSGVEVFQVCVCPSGKLFLAFPDSICSPDDLTC